MEVFRHHLYEYSKGLRRMILHTCSARHREQIEEILTKRDIPYLIQGVTENRINVFFGSSVCIEVVGRFLTNPLNELSDEEDFILGTLLGYDLKVQCRRYLKRKSQFKRIAV